jgi:outer membrane protein
MHAHIRRFTASLALTAVSTIAPAQPTPAAGAQWGLGLGVMATDGGYRGIGTETRVIPLLQVEYGRFRLFGPQAEFRLLGDANASLSLRAEYRLDGFDAGDSDYFAGMEDRKGSAFFGVSGRYATPYGDLSFELTKTGSESDGTRGSIGYAYPVQTGALRITPKIAAEFYDSKYVDYYYGVRAEEARAGRPAYAGESTTSLDVGVDVVYTFGGRHSVLGGLKYRRFGSEIQDSPLIDKSGSPRATLGYVYRF